MGFHRVFRTISSTIAHLPKSASASASASASVGVSQFAAVPRHPSAASFVPRRSFHCRATVIAEGRVFLMKASLLSDYMAFDFKVKFPGRKGEKDKTRTDEKDSEKADQGKTDQETTAGKEDEAGSEKDEDSVED